MGKPYLEFPRPRKHQQHRRKEPLWPDPWLSLVCPQIIVIRRIKMRGREVSDCIPQQGSAQKIITLNNLNSNNIKTNK